MDLGWLRWSYHEYISYLTFISTHFHPFPVSVSVGKSGVRWYRCDRLSLLALSAIIYYSVSGGPYGAEARDSAHGYSTPFNTLSLGWAQKKVMKSPLNHGWYCELKHVLKNEEGITS